jgi:glycosyltransferase involved in cell wall biosynthesis
MNYLILSDHMLPDHTGKVVPVKKGQMFDVQNLHLARKLLKQGTIADVSVKESSQPIGEPLPSPSSKRRVGFFVKTSNHYSGGRIHLWQIAWALADTGAEVHFVTNCRPMWEGDYPKLKNLKVITGKDTPIPPDLDLVFTDGKGPEGKRALRYKDAHPHTKLCVINFETHKWVAKFDPETASRMENTIPVLEKADFLFANSEESCIDVREAVGKDREVYAIPPVVNTSAIGKQVSLPREYEKTQDTPYVVWVARGSKYKGIQDAVNAVKSFKGKLNLIAIGQPGNIGKFNDDDHQFISFGGSISDAQKMKIIEGASCVLAPSKFEGYGMVPGESLCCGTPVVVYDLPVLRENYGNSLVYAKWGDGADFTKKVAKTIKKNPRVDQKKAQEKYGLQAMEQRLSELVPLSGKKRVSAQLICYYGPTVYEAIESVYPHVDEILIAYGPIYEWRNKKPDNALQLIKSFPDPEGKIKLEVRDEWKNKTEMRQWCCDNATGNRMLIFDADEIYHNLDKWIEKDSLSGCPRWVHFWHDDAHFVTDAKGEQRWGHYEEGKVGTIHPHYRWSHWKPSYSFGSTKGVRAEDLKKDSLNNRSHTERAVRSCPECVIYHLGHSLDKERMAEKHDFYLERDGKDAGRVRRKTAWHEWNGSTGSQGDGVIRKVDWEIPPLVKKAFERLSDEG